jgi:phosphoribosylamine--glycine ligase
VHICVVGSGGREHALAVALSPSGRVTLAPGNPGIAALSAAAGRKIECRSAAPESIDADLFVIGPEAPLVAGLADRLRAAGRLVFGPGADGARLEGSKGWMKELLHDAGVPTAAHGTFDEVHQALAFLQTMTPPYVIKTDGLAAGKGVLVTESLPEAVDDVRSKLDGSAFGEAGRRVVIEEGLVGREISVMAICDGRTGVPLAPAQDHKRAHDGDRGPNTGGMGAFSPVAAVPEAMVGQVMDRAVEPTLAELRRRGIDYRGVLYAGVMLCAEGPKILEFNVRFGDPETQVVMPRWETDVAEVLAAAAAGRLGSVPAPRFRSDAAVCVVMAAEGYPNAPRSGDPISGLAAAARSPGVSLYAAGVALGSGPGGENELVTAGGRVLGVSAVAPTLGRAAKRAYQAAELISWSGAWFRSDIGAASAD